MSDLKKVYTLVFLRKENKILLGQKKRGFGVGRWNGFGGRVGPSESYLEAAARELKEDTCVDVELSDLKNIGHLEFIFKAEPIMMVVRVFSAHVFRGPPEETSEMLPKWFKIDDIPFGKMWPDDLIWFPYMLNDKLFYGHFYYTDLNTISSYSVLELLSMENFYITHKK